MVFRLLATRRVTSALTGIVIATSLLFAGAAPAQPTRPGGFRIIGPGGGGALFRPVISPWDPNTVIVACDMSAGYITHDAGRTWRMFNLRGVLRQVLFDPAKPNVIYAVGVGLWRSDDNGDTWSLLAPRPDTVKGIANPTDEADVSILSSQITSASDYTFGEPRAMVVDPIDTHRMYAVLGDRLWQTKDAGGHWTEQDQLTSNALALTLVRHAGGKGAPLVIIGTETGVFIARGWHPEIVAQLSRGHRFRTLSFETYGDKLLVLATVLEGRSFYTWVDPFAHKPQAEWTEIRLPGAGNDTQVNSIASGHDRHTLYAAFKKLKIDGRLSLGIAKTTDMGRNWTIIEKDAGAAQPSNFQGGWIESDFSSDWGEEPISMTVAAQDHNLIYATNLGGVIKSTDGGMNWQQVYSRTAPDGGAATTGLDVTASFGVFFDPFDQQRLFVPYTDIGLMRSDNRGYSWRRSVAGVPFRWSANTYWLTFDPAVKGRMWAVMARTHDLPRVRMWRKDPPSTFTGGVVSSTDGGLHWSQTTDGMPSAAATYILLDPRSPASSRTLYVATMGHGIFKSTNGGKSWTAKNNGISGPEIMAWRMALASDGTLYAVIARRSEDGDTGGPTDGAVYRSRDGGETWHRLSLPMGVNGPTGITIDPQDPARLYLSAWGRNLDKHGVGGGIFLSTDAGDHFTEVFAHDQHVFSVTINPQNPSELYAAGFESSVWRSLDRGAHWLRIPGYNFKAATAVTPDPARPGMIYINTFGGGVWYGREDGKPGIEDILTKEVAP